MKEITFPSHQGFIKQPDGYFVNKKEPLIRFNIVQDIDPIFGSEYWDFSFEVFKRPYFFGLIGRKKWERSVQTNGFNEGLSFSKYLLKIK